MTPESRGQVLRDTPDWHLAEIRQEHFQAVDVEWADLGLGEKPGRKFAEGGFGRKLTQAFALQVQFILEVLLDLFRLPPVIRASRLCVAHAVDVDVGPIDVAALEERHRIMPPSCRWRSSTQRTIWL